MSQYVKYSAANAAPIPGTGTVTSIDITDATGILGIAGSPITTSGTITLSLVDQAANTVLAGPVSGLPGATTMRALVAADIPVLDDAFVNGGLKIGGANVITSSSVALEVDSTTKAILNARMTQAQRDLLTAINGMILYNTDTDKLQVYAAGVWVNLH